METQTTTPTTTPTLETTATDTPKTEEVVAPALVNAAETPTAPDVAVAVEGVEVSVSDTKEGAELSPAVGAVVVLVLGLLAVAVARLRKK